MANSGEVSLPITELEKVVMRRYGDLLRDIRTKVMLDNDCCKQIKKRKKKPKDHPMLLGIRVYIKKAKNNSWRAKKAKRVRLALASNRKNCSI
jgi:hypothetical protein